MHISETITGTAARLSVTGEIDFGTTGQLTTHVNRHIDDPAVEQVVVDLSGVVYIDSSGLSALISIRRRADARRKAFAVANARALVARVIEVTGLTRYLTDPAYDPAEDRRR